MDPDYREVVPSTIVTNEKALFPVRIVGINVDPGTSHEGAKAETLLPQKGAEAIIKVDGHDQTLIIEGPDNDLVLWRDPDEKDPTKKGWNKFPSGNGLHRQPVRVDKNRVQLAFKNNMRPEGETVIVESHWKDGVGENNIQGISLQSGHKITDFKRLTIHPAI